MTFNCYVQLSLPSSPSKFENFWMRIDGFWLVFSKKFDGKPQYLVPAFLQSVTPGEKETGRLNSLLIETKND